MSNQTEREKKISDALMSYLFGACQPDRGDVFSWVDDHKEEIASFIVKQRALDGGAAKSYKLYGNTAQEWRNRWAAGRQINETNELEIDKLRKEIAALRTSQRDGGAVSQDVELATLRRQLAEREAEVERLENEGQECARRLMLAEDARDEERKAAKRNAESSEILREFNKHPHYPHRPCGEQTCDSLHKRYERFLTMSENWCKKHGA